MNPLHNPIKIQLIHFKQEKQNKKKHYKQTENPETNIIIKNESRKREYKEKNNEMFNKISKIHQHA